MKNIPVSKKTWRKLKEIKRNKGFNVLNQTIEYLINKEENETLPVRGAREEVKIEAAPPITSKTGSSSPSLDVRTKGEEENIPWVTPEYAEEARKLNISAEEFIEYFTEFCKRKK